MRQFILLLDVGLPFDLLKTLPDDIRLGWFVAAAEYKSSQVWNWENMDLEDRPG